MTLTLTVVATFAFAQGAVEGEKSSVETFENLVKTGVAIITGVAALLGLPMVYLTYRKTSVEIKKLELEARQLMEASDATPSFKSGVEKGVRVNIHESPNSNVQVLADPRFLAPLLILLDFIFAWIILALTARLFSTFQVGEAGRLVQLILALFLLLPLAHQVMKIRNAMDPTGRTDQSPLGAQLKTITTVSYWLAVILFFGFGGLILYLDHGSSSVTVLGRYFAYGLITAAVVMLVCAAWARKKLNHYIDSI
ncbi:hypothetical protein [Leisingera sp. McT4-56]|uniref:hypothetical protein n=1 Tax=Leisingera sp. McT4-56 TaxID=2881255 RepID=UPI001CF8339B|nr:hypothetical protein [Leisingera sp. McT4-56]